MNLVVLVRLLYVINGQARLGNICLMAQNLFSFEAPITLGNILTIIAAATSALVAFFRVKGRLDVIEATNNIHL
jgi:chaperone required for assembly of F1-ATPase